MSDVSGSIADAAFDIGGPAAKGKTISEILQLAADDFTAACGAISQSRVAWSLGFIDDKTYAAQARLFIHAYALFTGGTKRLRKLIYKGAITPEMVPFK